MPSDSYHPMFVLVGLPLSGKSTLGRSLAARMNYTFFDLDEWVCQRASTQSVTSIFRSKGEPYFRALEQSTLIELMHVQQQANFKCVLATGGGSICAEGLMSILNQRAETIYLEMSWALMSARAQGSTSGLRPLLDKMNKPTPKLLAQHFEARISFYKQARLHFTVDSTSTEQQVKQLHKAILRHQAFLPQGI